jgi:hypothetical protein
VLWAAFIAAALSYRCVPIGDKGSSLDLSLSTMLRLQPLEIFFSNRTLVYFNFFEFLTQVIRRIVLQYEYIKWIRLIILSRCVNSELEI